MELKQYAEWNITRLGLIPAQSKLPAKYRMAWEQTRGDTGSNASIKCSTSDESGVPYGIANDIIAALMTSAIALTQNEDADGKIRITLEELGKMTFLREQIGGKQYQDLILSLKAMAYAKYSVTKQWRTITHKNQTFSVFSLINSFGIEESIKLQGKAEKNIYYIDLNELLWKSASGGLTLSLDPRLLTAVDSPTTRAIYRMLEAHRHSEDDLEYLAPSLSMRATDFADAARLLSTSSAISDRLTSLTRKNGAFEQLKREGYLQSIEMTGRGDTTTLHFQFAQQQQIIHTIAERLLIEHGILDSYALKLAQQFTSEEVECAIWLTEKAQKGGKNEIKNPAGLIIKLLTSGDAQNRQEEFKEALQKKKNLQARVIQNNILEEKSLEVPQKTAEEQLKTVLKVKKFKTTISDALKQAVQEERLTADQIKSLLFSINPEESAQKLLDFPDQK